MSDLAIFICGFVAGAGLTMTYVNYVLDVKGKNEKDENQF